MSVSNVDRSLDVLEALAQRAEGASLGALAEALALPKSAVHRLLQTLAERGYVVQDAGTQDYGLSLKLALLGFRFLDTRYLPDAAQAVLDRLAADTSEYCRIAVVADGSLTWVACAQGATAALRYEPPMGREVVLHATATGKAWLATLPEEDALAMVYRRGFAVPAGFGGRVARTVDALRTQLAATRKRGYALAVDEGEAGTTALATTFRAFDDARAPIAGTVSVAGPSARLDAARVRILAPRLHQAARDLTAIWPVRMRQRRNPARDAHAAAPLAAARS